jgi:hypothetical protein
MTSFTILGAKLKGRVRLSKTAINPQQEGLIIANIDRRLQQQHVFSELYR